MTTLLTYEKAADEQGYCYYKHKTEPNTHLHFHAAQEMIFVKRGIMYAIIDGKRYEIGAGEGCFVRSYLPHLYSHENPETEVFIFVATDEYFREAFSSLRGTPPVQFRFSDYPLLDALGKSLESSSKTTFQTTFLGTLLLLLSKIASENALLPQTSETVSDVVRSALIFVQNHYAEDLSLSRLAREFGYSPQHFSRLFHKHLQINLCQHVNAVRVVNAQSRIEKGVPVKTAAFECGFSSLESFYRAYKKHFRHPPRPTFKRQ